MNKPTNLFASTEIVGAIATSGLTASDVEALTADPKSVIESNFDIDVSGLDIKVIENSGNDIILTLPYYSIVEQLQAEALKDESLQDISGGEILITLGILAGIGVTITAGVAITGTAVAGSVVAVGGLVGGLIGGAAVAAAAGAGIAEGAKAHQKKKGK